MILFSKDHFNYQHTHRTINDNKFYLHKKIN